MIYWFIGQSGAGKTTLAKHLKTALDAQKTPAIHLDGDDLRRIFEVPYGDRNNFSKEYRSTQTRALQRFVAHVADQGINVIISTVNPYRDVREEFKQTRKDMYEILVVTQEIRGREHLWVENFEPPNPPYISIGTGGGRSEDEVFATLCTYLKRIQIVATIVSNVSIGGVSAQETKTFDSNEELDTWVAKNLTKYGGFPTVFKSTHEII